MDQLSKHYQNASRADLFVLNIHHLFRKYLFYIPSGAYSNLPGIFLPGYYLASVEFSLKKSTSLLIGSIVIGALSAISAEVIGGGIYPFPPTLTNILFILLSKTGQIFLCIFYVTFIFKIVQTATGSKALKHLIPVGRMALSHYVFQTLSMIIIFYNFGFNLFGKIGLMSTMAIPILILISQVILSNLWLKHFRYGALEWIWRSLTYKNRINIRY